MTKIKYKLHIPATPKLVMHYAPDFLIVLRRDDCPGRTLTWGAHGHRLGHTGCCDKNHHTYRLVRAHPVSTDEAGWCLERCWVRAHPVDKPVETT